MQRKGEYMKTTALIVALLTLMTTVLPIGAATYPESVLSPVVWGYDQLEKGSYNITSHQWEIVSSYSSPLYAVTTQFTVLVDVLNVTGLYATALNVSWNPSVLDLLSITNGSFLMSAGPGTYDPNLLATGGAINHVTGTITPKGVTRTVDTTSNDGNGTIYQLTFNVTGYGESLIKMKADLSDSGGGSIASTTRNVWFKLTPPPPPPATPGTVAFTESPTKSPGQPEHYYVNDTAVQFDPYTVTQAYNNITLTHGSATMWNWTLTNIPGAYSVSLDLCQAGVPKSGDGMVWNGSALNYTFKMLGEWTVCVKGYFAVMNDTTLLGMGIDYRWSDPFCVTKTIVLPAVGCNIDLYSETQRYCGYTTPNIGEGYNQTCDAYTIDEEVTLFVNLTYNNDPLQSRLVAFEVHRPDGATVLVRTAMTNAVGVANISFRIETVCQDPEARFGKWWAIATVKVCEVKQNDTMMWDVGYLVQVTSIELWDASFYGFPGVERTQYHKYADPSLAYFWVRLTLKNIAQIPRNVTISVTFQDSDNVAVSSFTHQVIMNPGEFCNPSETLLEWNAFWGAYVENTETWSLVGVPKWTYAGWGTVYVNIFSNIPSICGVPYSPEQSVPVQILGAWANPYA